MKKSKIKNFVRGWLQKRREAAAEEARLNFLWAKAHKIMKKLEGQHPGCCPVAKIHPCQNEKGKWMVGVNYYCPIDTGREVVEDKVNGVPAQMHGESIVYAQGFDTAKAKLITGDFSKVYVGI